MSVQRLTVLGSTGSIGTQALELIRRHRNRFEIVALSAGTNVELLAKQAVQFGVPVVGIADETGAQRIENELAKVARAAGVSIPVTEIITGPKAAQQLAARQADTVLNAITGAAGLSSTLAALEAGTDVALANKESLIIGGEVVLNAARRTGARLLPVDSEHSAIWQALRAGTRAEVSRLILTASGGPFRGKTWQELAQVTPAQALQHPTWDMGRVVTTNSASLVNKGLEVIEAHVLFGIDYDHIDVVVHPQSQVHSMVEFVDGSTLAQVSPPDMTLPIAYALGYEAHLPKVARANDWSTATAWTFEPVDHAAFPALRLAMDAGRAGGVVPAWYNAANEVFVDAFHDGHISFTDISDGLTHTLAHAKTQAASSTEVTAAEVLFADAQARTWARGWVSTLGSQESNGFQPGDGAHVGKGSEEGLK